MKLFQNITLSDNETFKLFDCLVGSVLSYSSEVFITLTSPCNIYSDFSQL